jgi:CheY-like chemotaxis protein
MDPLNVLRILLIEDSPVQASVFQRMLEDEEPAWQLDCADSLAAGLRFLDANRYDLVRLDLDG